MTDEMQVLRRAAVALSIVEEPWRWDRWCRPRPRSYPGPFFDKWHCADGVDPYYVWARSQRPPEWRERWEFESRFCPPDEPEICEAAWQMREPRWFIPWDDTTWPTSAVYWCVEPEVDEECVLNEWRT